MAVRNFLTFVLVLFRLSGIFIVAPIVGGAAVPWRIRVFLAIALSFAIYPLVAASPVVVPTELSRLVLGLAGELGIGLVCGLMVSLVFVAAQMAGEFISRQMGTSFAEMINPLFESPSSVFGNFYFMFAMVVFVLVNGHHVLVAGLVKTFDRVPLMGVHLHAGLVGLFGGLMQDMFVLMIKLAAPTFVALFLVTIALAFIARSVPQMNVMLVGFPLQVMLGLVIMALALGSAATLLDHSYGWVVKEIDVAARFMTP
jgi:flagellar biosynthetic protein FliR